MPVNELFTLPAQVESPRPGLLAVNLYLSLLSLDNPQLATERWDLFQKIMADIEVIGAEKPQVFIDPSLPPNVGGYVDPEVPQVIVMNPIVLLQGDPSELFRVNQHEAIHDGEIYEESITDLLAVLFMEEKGYDPDTRAGYHDLVTELRDRLTYDMTSQDLLDLIVAGDDTATLMNFIDKIFIEPMVNLEKPVPFLDIKNKIHAGWRVMERLFPRLLNSVLRPHAGMHDEAKGLSLRNEHWDMLMEKYTMNFLSLDTEKEKFGQKYWKEI